VNNCEGVKKYFNRAANIYDYNCFLQLEVARQLIETLKPLVKHVDSVIDLGCGTGISTQMIKNEIKANALYAVDIADQCLSIAASRLGKDFVIESSFDCVPFDDGVFDIVFSNMSFQWSCDLNKTVQEAARLLKPKGVLAFSLPNDRSFMKLRAIFNSLGFSHVLNRFVGVAKLYNLLSGCEILGFYEKEYILRYDNFFDLLRSIKNVGANYKFGGSAKRLNKSDFLKINENLLAEFSDEGIPLEYAVTFCVVQKV